MEKSLANPQGVVDLKYALQHKQLLPLTSRGCVRVQGSVRNSLHPLTCALSCYCRQWTQVPPPAQVRHALSTFVSGLGGP